MPETLAIELSNIAKDLIDNDFPSRPVTLVKLNTTPDDAAKPWRGTSTPRTAPSATLAANAIFVPMSTGLGLRNLSDELVKRTSQVALIALGATSTEEMKDYDEIRESDGTVWKITFSETLRPGTTNIIHYIGVTK